MADNYVASVATLYQQRLGAELAQAGFEIDDPNAYYLYYAEGAQQIWPYDDQCRLLGEDVWEPKAQLAKVIKLAPHDVVTTAQAAELLAPHIKPLPKFVPAGMSPGPGWRGGPSTRSATTAGARSFPTHTQPKEDVMKKFVPVLGAVASVAGLALALPVAAQTTSTSPAQVIDAEARTQAT